MYMFGFFRALAVMAAMSGIRWNIGPLRQEEYSWNPWERSEKIYNIKANFGTDNWRRDKTTQNSAFGIS